MQHFETVISRDGTAIAYERRGHGPVLVMVHGSGVDHSRWGGVVDELARHFTLCMVDRRGRGRSADAPGYAIEREFEDVASVVQAMSSPPSILAHSYGAICALEAARLTSRIARMAIYEPPFPVPGLRSFPAGLCDRMDALLARGDREGIVTTFLVDVLRMGPDDVALLRRTSGWPVRLAAAATLPREVAAALAYRFRPELFGGVRVPSLFLYGNRSPVALQASTRMAAAALAGSRLELLPGHAHGAMSTGPAVFLGKVLPFLLGENAGDLEWAGP